MNIKTQVKNLYVVKVDISEGQNSLCFGILQNRLPYKNPSKNMTLKFHVWIRKFYPWLSFPSNNPCMAKSHPWMKVSVSSMEKMMDDFFILECHLWMKNMDEGNRLGT